MPLKEDYAGGNDIEGASEINARNKLINSSGGMLGIGKYINLVSILYGGFYTDDANAACYPSSTNLYIRNATQGIYKYIGVGYAHSYGQCIVGNYIFIMCSDGNVRRVHMENETIDTLAASFLSGTPNMTYDGTDFFFNNRARQGDKTFGDATSRFDITEPTTGTFRYTWNGTGTDPNFVDNGVAVGKSIVIAGNTTGSNNGTFVVTAVTNDYIEVSNPDGDEILDNPDFTTSDNWTFSNGWTHDSGNNQADGSSTTGDLFSIGSKTADNGKQYKFKLVISNYSSGSIQLDWGPLTTALFNSNGTHEEVIAATYTFSGIPRIQDSSGATLSVDEASIKEAGGSTETVQAATFTQPEEMFVTRASLSGTTLTKEEDIMLEDSNGYVDYFVVDENYIYGMDISSPYRFTKWNKETGAKISESNVANHQPVNIAGNVGGWYSNTIVPLFV